MKIAFRADASVAQGTGHVVRSLTLAREFQNSGHQVRLISNIENVPWLSSMVKQSKVDWQNCVAHELNLDRIVREGFDLIVIDSYNIPSVSINSIRSSIPIMAIVDNDMRDIIPTLVLDQNLGAANFDASYPTKQMIGPKYSLVRQEIRELRRESGSWVSKQEIPTVLVMIGGTDPTKLAVTLSRMLCDLDSDYRFHFVTAKENVSEITKWLPKNRDNVHALSSEIQDLLKLADFAISAAGTSSLDLTCIGIPTIYISIASNQDANLEAISKLSIGLTLGQSKDIEKRSENLISSLEQCAYNISLRETLFQNSQKLVDGNGAHRVVKAVAETVQ